MSTFGNTGHSPPGAEPTPPPPAAPTDGAHPSKHPAGPPAADMKSSREMQAWLQRLQLQNRRIGARNRVLAGALAAGVVLLLAVLWWVYQSTIGAYAVIDNLQVHQDPVNQGLLRVSFDVLSPGKVHCRRKSGPIETDLIDHFTQPCAVARPWSWVYRPGEDIELTLWCRSGLLPKSYTASCPTLARADIVVLIDTTGSMDPSIDALREKCVGFSAKLQKMALKHRFALIGFGDAGELDVHDFSKDVTEFVLWVGNLKRYDGGDLPEAALDALEAALSLSYDQRAFRRFYLVTDAEYHRPTRSGATVEQIAARLKQHNVLLHVFSREEYRADYTKLLGQTGRFQEIENFGSVLSQARVLED